jgi:RNA polymerase sigma factor (sigma-70 family)
LPAHPAQRPGRRGRAFQATFLVLVRKAASITPRGRVGNWLYGVARQTALKARATRARRCAREKQVAQVPEPAVTDPPRDDELPALLDQALSRLPDKHRAVLVLCELEGKPLKETARHLGLPEGTVASRLARARAMLAKRLTRLGLPVSGASLAAVLAHEAGATPVPTSLLISTIQGTALVAAGRAANAGAVSAQIATLTQGVLNAMWLSKLKKVTATLLGLLAVAAVAGGLLRQHTPAAPREEPPGAVGGEQQPRAEAPARLQAKAQPKDEEDRIRPGDRLRIEARNTLPDRPIDKVAVVEPAGTVNLGVPYGRVQVRGLTFAEAETMIREHLARVVKDPQVSVERDVTLPEDRYSALERRVQRLETAVRDLQAAMNELRKQKGR